MKETLQHYKKQGEHATCYYYTGQAVAGYTQREAGPIPGRRPRRKVYELPAPAPEPGASAIRIAAYLQAQRQVKEAQARAAKKPPAQPRTYRASPHTRRRCRRAIAALLYNAQQSKDRVYMYTVTFSDRWNVTHAEAKHLWEVYTRRLVYHVRATTGVEPPLVRVSELQANGTIHFHTLIAVPERLEYRGLLDGIPKMLSRAIPRLAPVAQGYAGIWFTAIRKTYGQAGRYVGKMTSRLTGYLTKQAEIEFGCAVWSSNRAAKELPIGFASHEPEAVLFRPFRVSAYLTCYDFQLGTLFGEFAKPPPVTILAQTTP